MLGDTLARAGGLGAHPPALAPDRVGELRRQRGIGGTQRRAHHATQRRGEGVAG